MRILILVLAAWLSVVSSVQAESRVDIGGSIVDGNLRNFYLAIGEYYRVPERELVVIRDRHIPDYEVPVVLYIAERAHVQPSVIVDMRLGGHSWMDITLHFGLGPEIYYVPAKRVYGPPYGHAYGHYKNKHKKDWKRVRLDDDDVVNLVNLRFMSNRYKYAPEEVMRMRSRGQDFIVINEELRKGRKEQRGYRDDRPGEGGHAPGREKKEKHNKKGRED